jgi:hypothetical protein
MEAQTLIQLLVQTKSKLIDEVEQMRIKFVNLQEGVAWDKEELEYRWTNANMLRKYQDLTKQCDTLFNTVDRFLAKCKPNYHRFETVSKWPNNPHAYAARCARLIIEIDQVDTAGAVGGTNTGNRYCVCL